MPRSRLWFFTSDLHGHLPRYRALFAEIRRLRPSAVLIGGDLLPRRGGSPALGDAASLVSDFLAPEVAALRADLGATTPRLVLIPGNDDPARELHGFAEGGRTGLWDWLPSSSVDVEGITVFGYPFVPPTPFRLKDWERYDVSRQVGPSCVSPEAGIHTVAVEPRQVRQATIRQDLDDLAGDRDLSCAVFLFHCPPYDSLLDRAALDGRMVGGVPLDVHIGSVAIRRFIEASRPMLTLHGHVHESARLTGQWRDRIGSTHAFSGCTDSPDLSLVVFDPQSLDGARRFLVPGVA